MLQNKIRLVQALKITTNGNKCNKKEVIQQIIKNLSEYTHHQGYFSRTIGFSLPKSFKIAMVELATEFSITLTEENLTKISAIILNNTNTEKIENEINKLNGIRNSDTNNAFIGYLPVDTSTVNEFYITSESKNPEIKHTQTIINFIIDQKYSTGHFSEVINERKYNGIYKNSWFTKYNTNTTLNPNDVKLYKKSEKGHIITSAMALQNTQQSFTQNDASNLCANTVVAIENIIDNMDNMDNSNNVSVLIRTKDGTTTTLLNNIPKSNFNKTLLIKELNQSLFNPYYAVRTNEFNPNTILTKTDIEKYINQQMQLIIIDKNNQEYIIKAKLNFDAVNNCKYVTWECGTDNAFKKVPAKYMFHFVGNGDTANGHFEYACEISKDNDTIHVLNDYSNKSMNHLLTGNTANKTSFGGSINPHLCSLNKCKEEHNQKNKSDFREYHKSMLKKYNEESNNNDSTLTDILNLEETSNINSSQDDLRKLIENYTYYDNTMFDELPDPCRLNEVLDSMQRPPLNITIFAHSYGNLAAVKFIEKIKQTSDYSESNSAINIGYIGFATPTSLSDIAENIVGAPITNLAKKLHIIEDSEVLDTLNKFQIPYQIYNNTSDNVIPAVTQIRKEHLKENSHGKLMNIAHLYDSVDNTDGWQHNIWFNQTLQQSNTESLILPEGFLKVFNDDYKRLQEQMLNK